MGRAACRRVSAALTVLLVVLAGCGGVAGFGDDGTTATSSGATDTAVGAPTFREVAAARGFNYTSTAPPTMIVNGGVYATDYDGDGWPDLLAVGGPEPILFENTGGQFEPSGALPPVNATVEGAHAFDFDNDGREDLLLLAQDRPPILLENRGGGFVRRAGAFPVNMTYPVGATTADYDGDGCLDVFVIQYADWTERRPAGTREMAVSGDEDNGYPNYLFRGNCTGGFSLANGTAIDGSRWTLAASFVDFTGDGAPDIHVANDFNNDLLYVNRDEGFKQVVLGNETNRNAMSSEIADVNRDGRPDVFVTNILLPRIFAETSAELFSQRMDGNNLLLNAGDGRFTDAAGEYGVRRGGWGWAAVLADFDNDGDQDLFHTTKEMAVTPAVRSRISREEMTTQEYLDRHPSVRYPRYFERQDSRFTARQSALLGFETSSGTGVARVDFDRDGSLDIAIAQVDGPFLLYENRLDGAGGNAVRVKVRSTEGRPATGARVTVTVDGETRSRLVNSRADYLSQDSRIVHVGVGDADRVDRIEVAWPDGSEVVLEDIPADRRVVVTPDGEYDIVEP